jgi:hypothetical protein
VQLIIQPPLRIPSDRHSRNLSRIAQSSSCPTGLPASLRPSIA